MHARFLDAVKTFEGFTQKSSWDYAQHTNGFGTKALYPGEEISLEEANRRFLAEIDQARSFVEKHAQGWDEGTKAALTSLTFNAGTRWATSGLGDAVRKFDVDAVRTQFLEYTKAGGEVLPGLVKRRLAEVTWIGEGSGISTGTSQPSVASATSGAPLSAITLAPEKNDFAATASIAPSSEPQPLIESIQPTQSDRLETAEAQRASSVAWMLLALDMGTFNPSLVSNRNQDHDTSSAT